MALKINMNTRQIGPACARPIMPESPNDHHCADASVQLVAQSTYA